jgi:putative transposase
MLSMPPHVTPSRIMQAVKGKTSHCLMKEFRRVNKEFWGRHL